MDKKQKLQNELNTLRRLLERTATQSTRELLQKWIEQTEREIKELENGG